MSDRGEVKLLDFGLAKLALDDRELSPGDATIHDAEVQPSYDASGAIFTGTGALMGTPAYMAPELWWGHDASPRSDVFALGLVVYELIRGALPHAGLRMDEVARAITEATLPPLRGAVPDLPDSLAVVIDRAVRRDAIERYASAAELRAALEDVEQVFLPGSGGLDAIQIDPDRVAVRSSFARARARGDSFIASVYDRLFALEPQARALFPPDMREQRSKRLHTLGLATDSLAEPERLGPILEDLGRRHVAYGVEPGHFALLERALLVALADFDREEWTPDLARAWRRGFAFIEVAMNRGMALARTIGGDVAVTRPSRGA